LRKVLHYDQGKNTLGYMRKGYVTLAGYALFIIGFLSILLNIVGLQLSMLSWMSNLGQGTSIIIKLSMLFSGLIIMYISKMPAEED